jgi:hypothetical protein
MDNYISDNCLFSIHEHNTYMGVSSDLYIPVRVGCAGAIYIL